MLLASSFSLGAFGFSIYYAFRTLVNHTFELSVPEIYWFLNPLTFLIALGVSYRRTIYIDQQTRKPGMKVSALRSLLNPGSRQARVMRNYTMALSLGLIQGVVSGLGSVGLVSTVAGTYILNLSLLLMITPQVSQR